MIVHADSQIRAQTLKVFFALSEANSKNISNTFNLKKYLSADVTYKHIQKAAVIHRI